MLMLMNAWMMLVLMKCKCQMQCLTLGCYMSCDTPVEESESEGTFPMDLTVISEEHFGWTVVGFSRVALSRQFREDRDSPSPFFHSRIQYWLYRGGIDIRPMDSD